MPRDSSIPSWESNYGKTFKVVVTPSDRQIGGDGKPSLSVVTPANGDAWNWPEADRTVLDSWKKNWGSIYNSFDFHKRYQILSGMNMDQKTGKEIERGLAVVMHPYIQQIMMGVR